MSLLWSSLLKLLAAIGHPRFSMFRQRAEVRVGDPQMPDATGGNAWQQYLSAASLFDAWAPLPGSPWEPFHCATLFAAIERIRRDALGPAPQEWYGGALAEPMLPPSWATPEVMILVDLAGRRSVAVGAWLCIEGGYQPVCTFDNWPHQDGLVHPESVLAALLRYAALVDRAKQNLHPAAPPVWICDGERLGNRIGRPKDFDNRYYLDDSILPAPELLRTAGIRSLVYVVDFPQVRERPDLSAYFESVQQQGIALKLAAIGDEATWAVPIPLQPTKLKFNKSGFFRSTAGGFGAPIPEPSSSSG